MSDTRLENYRRPGCQLKDCMYHSFSGCSYLVVEGVTRTSLHIGENVDINNPCREYTPGKKSLLNVKPFTLSKDML